METIKIEVPEGKVAEQRQEDDSIIIRFKDKPCKKNFLRNNGSGTFVINGAWVLTLYTTEEQGHGYIGEEISGHAASMYLVGGTTGQWYDQNGNLIKGYLFYKPAKE